MAGFSQKDRENLSEFLQTCVGEEAIFSVAKSFTKNAIPVYNVEEAFEVIFLHGSDIRTVLNKRHVTKDILFRYLHDNKIAVRPGFTKQILIEDIIQHWAQREESHQKVSEQSSQNIDKAENFPINIMARQFTKWFFERYNANELTTSDFWVDADLEVTIYFEDGIDDRDASSSEEVVETLYSVKRELQLLFNACTLHQGCQGRIDIHGLVLVLSCGTIHTPELCVGVFEAVFNLARDPFAENNWKIKKSNFVLRSKSSANDRNALNNCESMRKLLALPVSDGEF